MQSTTPSIASTSDTLETLARFDEAFNSHDIDAIMDCMTEDCVFESTFPPPDGERIEGAAAVRRAWEALFAASPDAHFETEEHFVIDDRCAARWLYTYTDSSGEPQHLRGVDIFRVRNGKVAEKFSYVKG